MKKEKDFKNELINNLKGDFIDGDKSNNTNKKSADLVSDNEKVAIEIKDDYILKINTYKGFEYKNLQTSEFTRSGRFRQFRRHFKVANEKFQNSKYDDYKTVLILRTELMNLSVNLFKKLIIDKSFWDDFQDSSNEVGGCLFWSDESIYYINNKSKNVNRKRIIGRDTLVEIFSMYDIIFL